MHERSFSSFMNTGCSGRRVAQGLLVGKCLQVCLVGIPAVARHGGHRGDTSTTKASDRSMNACMLNEMRTSDVNGCVCAHIKSFARRTRATPPTLALSKERTLKQTCRACTHCMH